MQQIDEEWWPIPYEDPDTQPEYRVRDTWECEDCFDRVLIDYVSI